MALRPICEPVELPAGTSVIERVTIEAGTAGAGDFAHFHDVAELVLFRRVSGTFIAGRSRQQIGDGSIVFIPSMHHHDFALPGEAMEWLLIQFDPDLLEGVAGLRAKLQHPFCLVPDERSRARIDILADWLVEIAGTSDPAAERVAALLLLAIGEAGDSETPSELLPSPVERLMPALERLRRAPGEPIALRQAATLCRVTPAYFSRRFRQLFAMTFTDYARTYRLRLAARRLAASGAPVSEIAYGVGFSSPAHFSARFRERFGMTPREYRKSARTRAAGQGRKKA